MMQSEQIDQLVTALAKAQGEILPAAKDGMNPHFKNKYAGLPSIWAACREPLSRNGLVVMQATMEKDGKLQLVTTLAHSSGQWVKSYMPVVSAKPDAQSMGSALTYAQRYSLRALVGVVADDDDDGEKAMQPVKTAHSARTTYPPAGSINQVQALELRKVMNQCHQNGVKSLFDHLKSLPIPVESLDHIPQAMYEEFMKMCIDERDAYQLFLKSEKKEATNA